MITVNGIKTANKNIVSTIRKNLKQREQLPYSRKLKFQEINAVDELFALILGPLILGNVNFGDLNFQEC